MMTDAGHRWAGLARDCADAYVNENWHKVQANARMLLAEVLEGEALERRPGRPAGLRRIRAPVQLPAARPDRPRGDREGRPTRSLQ